MPESSASASYCVTYESIRINDCYSQGGCNCFKIDAPGIPGGRFIISHFGGVGIGVPGISATSSKLTLLAEFSGKSAPAASFTNCGGTGAAICGSSVICVDCRPFPGCGTGVQGCSGSGYGVLGQSIKNYGVKGTSVCNSGVYGCSLSGTGVTATGVTGLFAMSSETGGQGVHGFASGASSTGVHGCAACGGTGVKGCSNGGAGVWGCSNNIGVMGNGNIGVIGAASSPGAIPLLAQGACGQTANLQQWSVLCSVKSVVNKCGWLGVGRPCAPTTLAVAGSVSANTVIALANYMMGATDFAVLAKGAITVTLPPASTAKGMIVFVKNTSKSTVTLDAFSGTIDKKKETDTIEGASSKNLKNQYDSLQLISNGTNEWYVLGNSLCSKFTS